MPVYLIGSRYLGEAARDTLSVPPSAEPPVELEEPPSELQPTRLRPATAALKSVTPPTNVRLEMFLSMRLMTPP